MTQQHSFVFQTRRFGPRRTDTDRRARFLFPLPFPGAEVGDRDDSTGDSPCAVEMPEEGVSWARLIAGPCRDRMIGASDLSGG